MARRRQKNPNVDIPVWVILAGLIGGAYYLYKNQTTVFGGTLVPAPGTKKTSMCYPPPGLTATPVAPTNGQCPLGWSLI